MRSFFAVQEYFKYFSSDRTTLWKWADPTRITIYEASFTKTTWTTGLYY